MPKKEEVINSKVKKTATNSKTKTNPKNSSSSKASSTKKTTTQAKKTTQSKITKKPMEKNDKNNKSLAKMYNKITKIIKENKIISVAISIVMFVALLILLVIIPIVSKNKTVITIGENNYTSSDFMIYLYSVKYNYFGEDNTKISEATLNMQVDNTNDMTIKEYLKKQAIEEIKVDASINKIAKENNITLSNNDLKEVTKEKNNYINELGGKSEFKKFLKENNTTENSYDKMIYTKKVYDKIYKSLYADGKTNDLTEEEKEESRSEYYSNYFKIKQIVLTLVDSKTKKNLDEITINQKEAATNTILEEAQSNANFDDLIKKYSEDAISKEPPYDVYYQKGDLLEEIEGLVNNLNVGDTGKIKTKYAIHIIQKQELDDAKLGVVYEKKREDKLLKNISDNLEDISIIYHDNFEKLQIK